MWKRLSLEGFRFGNLVVVKMAGVKNMATMWECLCDCGNKKTAIGYKLTKGELKSCGCLTKTNPNHKKHGYYKHKLYKLYQSIKTRCYDENDASYSAYGAVGVTMSDEWYGHPDVFISWALENGWREGLQIDKDIKCKELGIVPAIYSSETCQFVTRVENMNARRNSRRYVYENKEWTLKELSERFNIKQSTLAMRMNKYGYSLEQAIQTPLNQNKNVNRRLHRSQK